MGEYIEDFYGSHGKQGDLQEEVYMQVPPGFDKEVESLVCWLKKSLYDLKLALANGFLNYPALLSIMVFIN